MYIWLVMPATVTIEKKTVRDYQLLPEGAPYQLINGKLIMSPSPNRIHQKLIGEIFRLIANHLNGNLIGEVYIAPSDVYLDEENVVQPDIYFVSKNNSLVIHVHPFFIQIVYNICSKCIEKHFFSFSIRN